MICDLIGSQAPNAMQRRSVADVYTRYEPLWRRRCAGSVLIVNSQIVRGAMTALTWLRPPPFPTSVVMRLAEAEQWAEKQLATFKPSVA